MLFAVSADVAGTIANCTGWPLIAQLGATSQITAIKALHVQVPINIYSLVY